MKYPQTLGRSEIADRLSDPPNNQLVGKFHEIQFIFYVKINHRPSAPKLILSCELGVPMPVEAIQPGTWKRRGSN